MRVAYLINQYPKTSHTFIRREIRALESNGVEVFRYSLRSTAEVLVDEADREELRVTRALLQDGTPGLLDAALKEMLERPVQVLSAAAVATRLGWRSERGLGRHLAYLSEACLLVRLLARTGVEHVHAHFGTNSATVAMLCRALGGPTYSFTVHGPDEFDKPEFIGLQEKVHGAAFVVAISCYGRSQLLRQSEYEDWPKIHVVRCGLDESYLTRDPLPVPDRRRLVCVGRLSKQKGQLLLLEAAAQLRAAGADFELVLAGDGEMRKEIEAGVRRHGLEDRVRITGWLDGNAVQRELESARALVLPSFAEGLPVVIMEAFALGRPVVSTYVAGIPELVQENESGWLVPPGSAESLAGAMDRVLRVHPDELTRMGREGRKRVLESHDINESARKLKHHIEAKQ
jgi:colanic acid/amylovoran biosynthesis glycosyltransferase